MQQILFEWRGFRIQSYRVLAYVGLLAGIVTGSVSASVAGLDQERAYVATITLLVSGLIGARLFHVAQHWQWFRARPADWWNRSDGGMGMFGGLVVMVLVSLPVLAALDLSFAAYWDSMVFTGLVLLIWFRIGCLLHGCCAGCASQCWLALDLPNAEGVRERRIPTQLLEAGWCALLLFTALAIWPALPFRGALALLGAAGYGAGRLVFQSTRERAPQDARFTVQHGFSLVLVIVPLVALLAHWSR